MKQFFQKTVLGLILMHSGSLASLAQSVIISPDNLQMPSVSVLPACAAADYGKIVFLTTTNRANVCGGSGWIEVSTGGGGGLTLPFSGNIASTGHALQIGNTAGGLGSSAIQGYTFSLLTGASGIWGAASQTAPTGDNVGVRGFNSSTNGFGYGVHGRHNGSGFGVYGESVAGRGVYGLTSGNGVGVYGETAGATSTAGYFVVANNTATAGRFISPANFNNTGRALYTTGSIRFANIGESTGKFLKCADANGVAIWDNITRLDTKVFLASDLVANSSAHVTSIGTNGLSVNSLSSGTTATLFANLNLPDQAAISSLKLIYFDNDASASISSCQLQSAPNSSSTWTSFGSVTIPATNSANLQNVSATFTQIINATTTHYRLAIVVNASANVAIRAVEIGYSYSFDQ